MGAIIGHEVSHSFDNQGALFDSHGRLHNWWTPEDFKHFAASSAQLAAQYSSYRPFPDLAVNGKQTLGENIADLAGLAASYDAYHKSLGTTEGARGPGFLRRSAVLHQLRPVVALEGAGAGPAEPGAD